jgi:hypothetical protein
VSSDPKVPITYRKIKFSRDVHPKSDYSKLVTPYYRNEAAISLQSAFKRRMAIKKAKEELQSSSEQDKPVFRKKYFSALFQQSKRIRALEEPDDISLDDEFNQKLLEAIKSNQYHLIDFTQRDFPARLFAALRLKLITSNQLLTIKLMYESLICFNKGVMPESSGNKFKRFKLSDTTGPYQAAEAISYWNPQLTDMLQEQLALPQDDEAAHYYTTSMPKHQAVGFLYFAVENNINTPYFIKMLRAYCNSLPLSNDERNELPAKIDQYTANPQEITYLKELIRKYEPRLRNFFDGQHRSYDPIQNLGLRYEEFNREWGNTKLLVNIYALNPQMPSVCLSPNGPDSSGQPLLCFVLPTIDTFNMLQRVAHGAEATLPAPVVGQETTRLIRAFDELPAAQGTPLTPAQEVLATLYPTALELDAPSRPVELTYPGVDKNLKPHGASAHDFLLSWHDVFHAWRNGTNYKELIRYLRKLNDEKLGFAKDIDGMSKVIWELTDADFSIGTSLRKYQYQDQGKYCNLYQTISLLVLLSRAGFNFGKPCDDNYLFIYSLCQSTEEWQKHSSTNLNLITSETQTNYTTEIYLEDSYKKQRTEFAQQFSKMKAYLQAHPKASVVDVILNDLLQPQDLFDTVLLKFLAQKNLKDIFYWSKNTGLYFKEDYNLQLQALGVSRKLRDNTPAQIRGALRSLMSQEQQLELKQMQVVHSYMQLFPEKPIKIDLPACVLKIQQAAPKACDEHSVIRSTVIKNLLDQPVEDLRDLIITQGFDFDKLGLDTKQQLKVAIIKMYHQLFANKPFMFDMDACIEQVLPCSYFSPKQQDTFIKKTLLSNLFDNPDAVRDLTPSEKDHILEVEEVLINIRQVPLGDGRHLQPSAPKNVKIKTIEDLRTAITNASKPDVHQIADIKTAYQLLIARYQSVFETIKDAHLYTRASSPQCYHTNQQTKALTGTQLLHIKFLKRLFVEEADKLITKCQSQDDLHAIQTYLHDSLPKDTSFINFNRTRYQLFTKETTGTKTALELAIQKQCTALEKSSSPVI